MSTAQQTTLPSDLHQATGHRLNRLRDTFSDAGIDAMLVGHEDDIRYLTGFCGHDTELLVTPDHTTIVCDNRYDTSLEPWRHADGFTVVMGTRHRLSDSVRELAASAHIRRLGVQADRLTVIGFRSLATALPDLQVVETTNLVTRLRQNKDDLEIAAIRHAIRVHHEALTATMQAVEIGMTERELYAVLDHEMKNRGATAPSFDAIIGVGANSALPHHETGDTPITEGVLLIDAGASVNGYCSDITRTFGVGSMPDTIREIYQVVLDAQIAAIEYARPGVTCADTDKAARDVIEAAGYGKYFGHGLGHSMGINVHESPYFNHLETTTVLEPGMIMTFEPGIYIPGVGGVRIEDDVLITETGTDILSEWPKQLDDMIITPAGSR
ncbi:MAG: Xaa-Pro peptidase family protein [Planctomycetota bacterium]